MACSVGVERSRVEVQFRDINYEAEVLIGSAGLPTVGKSLKNLALVTPKPMWPLRLGSAYNSLSLPVHMTQQVLPHWRC